VSRIKISLYYLKEAMGSNGGNDWSRLGSQIILLDFLLPSNCEASYCEKQVLTMFEKQLDGQMAQEKRDNGYLSVKARFTGDRVSTAIYAGPYDILLTLRFAKEENLLTLTIEAPHLGRSGSFFKDGPEEQHEFRLFESNNDVLKFESRLKEFLMNCRSQSLPIMSRGLPISPYWTTTDDRLVEAPITKVLYDQQSEHQHIMVLDTTEFGKLLVLDDQANLAESDLVYTTTLMGGGTEDFKDKQILILGGGDGALLCELLKHNPKKVTMVELDKTVMEAVREHMPSVAGGALDCKGERSKVIVGDAIKYLEDSRRQGRQFDFIFGDLTDIPIDTDHNFDSSWEFLRRILNLSFSCLRPGAKYMTHLTGKAVPNAKGDFQHWVEIEASRS